MSAKKKPKLITRIGPYEYKLNMVARLQDEDGNPCYALHDLSRATIELESENDVQTQFTSKWHETLHGILYCGGAPSPHDEKMIELVSHGIAQVLRDNQHMRNLSAFEAFIKE